MKTVHHKGLGTFEILRHKDHVTCHHCCFDTDTRGSCGFPAVIDNLFDIGCGHASYLQPHDEEAHNTIRVFEVKAKLRA